MWDEARFQDQVERVRSSTWDITIIETDPVVVRVYDEEIEQGYEVTPASGHCSCTSEEDADSFCDHIVALLDAEGYAGALMREYIKEKKIVLKSRHQIRKAIIPMPKKK